jgi:hypothetical protein
MVGDIATNYASYSLKHLVGAQEKKREAGKVVLLYIAKRPEPKPGPFVIA